MEHEYKYEIEERTINGKKYNNVIIPKKHTTIDALVIETRDLNAWDDWANITRYHTTCLILKKQEKEWETLYDGDANSFKINGIGILGKGIFNLLFQLESKKVRERVTKKAKIKQLKQEIIIREKRLQLLQSKKGK